MGVVRLLLAISVVCFHSKPLFGVLTLIPGDIAVKSFFIISGFYMSLILNEKYERKWDFYRARLLKIFPTYWAIAGIGIFLGSFVAWQRMKTGEISIPSFSYFSIVNFFIVGSELTPLLVVSPTGGLEFVKSLSPSNNHMWSFLILPPVWSLSVELYFYFLAPWIVKLNRTYPYKILAIFAADTVMRYYFKLYNVPYMPWNYNTFIASFAYFILGSLSYCVYAKIVKDMISAQRLLGILGFSAIFFTCLLYNKFPAAVPFGEIFFISLGVNSFFLLTVFLFTPFVFELTKKSKADRLVGEIAYPVYLSGWLFTNYYTPFESLHPVIPSVLTATVVHFLVAKPLEKYRSRSRVVLGNLSQSPVPKDTSSVVELQRANSS